MRCVLTQSDGSASCNALSWPSAARSPWLAAAPWRSKARTQFIRRSSSGGSFTEKAKQAAQTIEEKTKETAEKVWDKAKSETSQTAQSGQSSGSSGSGGSAGGTEQMQKQADADYKSAKAQCDTKSGQQKTICEKEATAAHAQAEVQVEKAKATTMGAGPSTQNSSRSSSYSK